MNKENKEKNIKLKIKLESNESNKIIQYVPLQKNILTISYEIPQGLTKITYYSINNYSLESSFSIKFKNEHIFDKWQIHETKNNKLYLIGYMNEFEGDMMKKNNKKLGIFLLDITKRNIEKKNSFKYNLFILDKKEDKIFLTNNGSIISYNLLTNISKIKAVKQNETFFQRFLSIQNYLLLINMTDLYKWVLGVKEIIIIDKNLENKIRKNLKPNKIAIGFFEGYSYYNYKKGFVKISDNKYFICHEGTYFSFLEINLKGNEHVFNDVKKLPELFDNEKIISIKNANAKNSTVCPLDEKYFLINFDNSIFYLCDVEKFEINFKYNVNLPLLKTIGNNHNNELEIEDEKLLSIKIKGPYYEFICVNKENEILYISNK